MVERLLSALGVRCTLRKQRSRFDSGKGTHELGVRAAFVDFNRHDIWPWRCEVGYFNWEVCICICFTPLVCVGNITPSPFQNSCDFLIEADGN